MYRIDRIVKVRHDDGRIEVVPCDATVELLALELGNIGISYPVKPEDEYAIFERFADMYTEIGQVEEELTATRKYDEQVCRAVDEFNCDDDGYIDFDALNGRLKAVMEKMEDGTFKPYVAIKWRKRK